MRQHKRNGTAISLKTLVHVENYDANGTGFALQLGNPQSPQAGGLRMQRVPIKCPHQLKIENTEKMQYYDITECRNLKDRVS